VPVFDGEAVSLGDVLNRQVELLRQAHQRRDPVAAEVLRSYFGADGKLKPGHARRALRAGADGPELPAAHLLEYALIQAAGHGRREVVEFLLGKQPDLSITEPFFGATARGAANYQGHAEIAALIEERLAPL
jgi:hypothetical protein